MPTDSKEDSDVTPTKKKWSVEQVHNRVGVFAGNSVVAWPDHSTEISVEEMKANAHLIACGGNAAREAYIMGYDQFNALRTLPKLLHLAERIDRHSDKLRYSEALQPIAREAQEVLRLAEDGADS